MLVRNIHNYSPPENSPIEVVERKGLGHPDTLADGIAEAAEIAYAAYCKHEFGYIPHHNLDKAMLLGGLCVQQFGGGHFEAPIRMHFMGRASFSFGKIEIPVPEIQRQAAADYLTRILPRLDIDSSDQYVTQSLTSNYTTRPHWFSPRSAEDLPEYSGDSPRANDTATMISYWPLTPSEKLALDLEGFFYSNNHEGLPKPRYDWVGQDIKVMVIRRDNDASATIAIPQITYETPDSRTYFERQDWLEDTLKKYADELDGSNLNVDIQVNPQAKGSQPRPYLVTAGSCTDFGEEGAVGRGNKTHGIISSFRPNTMEAPHGKNPTYFVGKVLGYQADLIAKTVYDRLGSQCQVVLQADIGDKLFEPSKIFVSTAEKTSDKDVSEIIQECLALGRSTTDLIIGQKYFIPRTNSWVAENE